MTNKTNYKQTNIGEIPEEWESTTLGKLADITSSKRIFASEYQSDGVPFFRGKEIIEKNKGDLVSIELFISEDKFQEIKDKFGVPKENDILLTSVGTLGVPYRVKSDDRFYFKDGNITWFRDLDNTTSRFLFHFLNSDFGKRKLIEKSIGSTQQALTIVALKSVEIAFPPINERKQIVSILSSLDDKIELNRRMNKTLEEMGKALFKHWFVDFEFPNEEGKPYKSSGGEMVDSELGQMPKEWKVIKIDNVVSVKGGTTPSTKDPKYWDGTFNWATPKDLSGLQSSILLDTERKITEKGLETIGSGLLPAGSILLSSRAPIGYLAISNIPVAINQGFIAIVCDKELSTNYMYFWVHFYMDLIKSKANGSTFLEVSKSSFKNIDFIKPTSSILGKFQQSVTSLFQQITNNEIEINSLTLLRESLLPRLMSGKLRV